jgi:type I restriction enzyme S subunit
MSPERLLKHFDQISEAPDAVQRLRRFILDLAVRGKLVEQYPGDEPAAELLKRIEDKKSRFAKAGSIRTPKPLDPVGVTEVPFVIPISWEWIRLAEAGTVVGGGTPPSTDPDCFTSGGAGIAWLTPADLGKQTGLYVSHGARDLTEKGFSSSSAQLMPVGSVLFTSRAPIGYTAIAANEISTNQGFKSVVPFIMESSRYIALYFNAFATWIDGKASGTTFKEVSGKIVSSLPFPLPPLAEQHRIVAIVDELMKLCDELEAAQSKRERRRDRLVAAMLAGLTAEHAEHTEIKSSQPFSASSAYSAVPIFLNHLPRFTTRPEHIQQLRQTILNLAVRGKLVPQAPKDEPAAVLLKRIEEKKTHLIHEGKIRQGQILPPISKDEIPFEIPKSWLWVRVSEVADSRLGKMLDKAKNKGIPRRYLRNVNVRWFDFDLSDLQEMRFLDSELEEFSLRTGDVLVCEGGEPGRCAVWNERESEVYFQKAVHRLRFFGLIVPLYFARMLRHDAIFGRLEQFFTGVGIQHFTGKGLARYSFPLPPLAEQCRIVAKVDELMSLCDKLERQLSATSKHCQQLLEATISEALAR